MDTSKQTHEKQQLPTVSVIIPTTCQKERSKLLYRAIESIVTQIGVIVNTIVVVNGSIYDSNLLTKLTADPRIRVLQIAEGNVSVARHVGIRSAIGRYFCFLDDDDEYLPSALVSRFNLFVENNTADVVVTNGFEHIDGRDFPLVPRDNEVSIQQNPGISFFRRNWFASPASMFDSEAIGSELFDFSHKYFEWTYLLFLLLSRGKKIHFSGCMTYRKYEDNPLSVSKSEAYALAYPDFIHKLLDLPLDVEVKRKLRKRYSASLNARSTIELKRGTKLLAWKSHIKCLSNGGWEFITYTRHLIFDKRLKS